MSNQYPGGIITKNPATPTGPYETGAAPGIWTLTQQAGYKQQGVWPIAGNAVPYIEDMFQTYLYTGNGTTNTITNGIDLSTKGGLVWMKSRSNAFYHGLYDTVRGTGTGTSLYSNTTEAQGTNSTNQNLTAFNTTGFTLGATSSTNAINGSGDSLVSWTFREQPKFFDVVTYTGDGVAGRTVAHNLGSTPGCIIVKNTSASGDYWNVYHRSLGATKALFLNDTQAAGTYANVWNNTEPTSTVFSLGTSGEVNRNGNSFVAYLFAHDAGGFGLTGTDNVISCGTWTGNTTVNLGYEPQWVLIKRTDSTSNWFLLDVMRGWTAGGILNFLLPNSSAAESTDAQPYLTLNSTGFAPGSDTYFQTGTFIYIAIRRGPMKVPTTGTSVFDPEAYTGNSTSGRVITTSNLPDLTITKARPSGSYWPVWFDRLRGGAQISSNNTDAETAQASNYAGYISAYGNLGYTLTSGSGGLGSLNDPQAYIGYAFSRAPSFFDEVCYTGTGSTRTVTHNLGVTPELVITKSRSQALGWVVWTTSLTSTNYWIRLDDTMAQTNSPTGYGGTFSASNYTIANAGPYNALNNTGSTYVAYLFATCAGVSKVGSYTGNGSTQTINCGFTGGARFVLIKRTDSTGDWYVYDTARGMTVLTDPYLWLNSANAEVATLGSVTTVATGFALNSTILAAINTNAASYIFLAIA